MPSVAAGSTPPSDFINLHDYRARAESLLPANTWGYVDGGAGDEHSRRWNGAAWNEVRLLPRVLVNVEHIDTTLELLGAPLAHPVLLAPTAAQRMYHPGAEAETLRGAAQADALAIMSTLGSTPVVELGKSAAGPWWFQLYLQPDRDFSLGLIERAVESGASALVLTVDLPLLGARDRDRRHGGHTVDGLEPPNLEGAVGATGFDDDGRRHTRVYNQHLDPTLSWDTLDWLVDISPVPVLAKGILRADDASRAVDHGVAAVVVSNHGARNLDTVVATVEALPPVVRAVDGQVPVLVDGGIRRGTDIAKAVCLGATAVLVGRPAIWGLAVGGADGVADVVDILRAELVMAMGLLGAPDLAALTPDLLAEPR
jgi:isopentenyl diphosphate isomerase/L-lactate dehydrogenase-like FMN-dependent dehydrogenase